MRQPHSQAGFTLIELMIVVAIIGIVATLMIGVSSRTYGANSKNASEQLAANLNAVKSRAIATRRIHRAYVKTNEILVWASDTTGMTDDNDPSDDPFVMRIAMPQGVTVYNVDASLTATNPSQNASINYELKYKPDGSANGGSVFLIDGAGSKHKVVAYKTTGSVFARVGW